MTAHILTDNRTNRLAAREGHEHQHTTRAGLFSRISEILYAPRKASTARALHLPTASAPWALR